MNERFDGFIELYGFCKPNGIKLSKELIAIIKDIGLSEKLAIFLIDSSSLICNGKSFQPPGHCPHCIKINCQNGGVAREISNALKNRGIEISVFFNQVFDTEFLPRI